MTIGAARAVVLSPTADLALAADILDGASSAAHPVGSGGQGGVRARRRTAAGFRRERGMVTAEIAMAMPALVVITAGMLFVVGAVGAQLRCVDAAREASRELARGQDEPAVTAAVLGAAPAGARLAVSRQDGLVTATVTARAPVFGPLLAALPGVAVSSSATALDETRIGVGP